MGFLVSNNGTIKYDYEQFLNLTKISKEELDSISSGEYWVFGDNTAGRLGDGTIVSKSTPVQIGAADYWKNYVDSTGRLFMWGDNTNGWLGDNTVVAKSSPIQIGSLTNWKQVSSNNTTTLAIKADGTMWAWGLNSSGQLGHGSITGRSSPVQVGGLNNWKQVDTANATSAAVKSDGTLWTWGLGTSGQLGDGTVVTKSSPVQVGSLRDWKEVQVGGTGQYVMALKVDGTLWAWGAGANGILGDGTAVAKSSPVQVGNTNDWKRISAGNAAAAAIKKDGTLWTWGANTTGQLGLGDINPRSSPTQVGTLKNWKYVKTRITNNTTFGIKTDGTLWAWGGNGGGQIGDGTIVPKSSPVQVGSFTDWKEITELGAIRYGTV
jgi:alpha-tubulin suppressor-like RCC1 family protein